MLKVVATLLAAAAGGLGFLSYHHPRGYAKIYIFLATGLAMLLAWFIIWNIATEITRMTLSEFVDSSKRDAATAAVNKIYFSSIWIWLCGGSLVYTWFLAAVLPKLLESDK